MVVLWYKDVVILFSLGKSVQYSQYCCLVSFQEIELELVTLSSWFRGLRNYLAKFKILGKEIF